MKRRKLVALVSAFTLLTIVFIAIVVIGVGVGTDPGREQIRELIQQQLDGRVKGTIHLGRIRGGLLKGFTLDTFAIRDEQDSILVSTGRITLQYDPRDLMDRRLLLRNVQVEHPVVHLRQYVKGDWNFQRVFRKDGPSVPGVPGRSFGDFVVLDSVRVRNGSFLVTRPWSPDDSLTGAKRDSAIRRNLTNPDREIRRSAEGLTHTYRWSRAYAFLPHVRLAHPDSNQFGQEFRIEDMRVEEQEPPFSFRNARGVVRRLDDSIFVNIAHFELPASRGSAFGKIWWGSGLPVRVDVNIKADTVALKDVAWVYETLPRVGGGRTRLRIRNNPANLHDFRYELTGMDVVSEKSRLTGGMTFVVGGPILEVVDVDLRAAPVNFDLVRTLAGEPLPVDWQGDLFGFVKGPGGPLTNFVIAESDVTWRDTHVRGAVSRMSGSGGLDILDPELTRFRGFDVSVASLDLRSIEYLFPEFLRLGGTLSGTARLDSLWLDVRFSNANVVHRNGPGEPSRITGSGRVTWAEEFMTYDLAVTAQPVSLTMLSRAYPLHLRGLLSGPVRARGTTDDLQVNLDLKGPAGRITYNGRVDAYPLSVAATGSGRVDELNPGLLTDMASAPSGWLTGPYELSLRADTSDLGTTRGAASLFIERGEIDGTRIFPSRVRARFADRRLFLDTLRVESVAAAITASGAIGLTERGADSLEYQITVDSLGGLRRYVGKLTSSFASPGAAPDSLSGSVTVVGSITGALTSLDVAGQVVGTNVVVRREAGREISGSFALSDVLNAPTGSASIKFDVLNVGGIALDTLGATVKLDHGRTGTFQIGARGRNNVTLDVQGDLSLMEIRNEFVVRALTVVTDSSTWSLRSPAHVYTAANAFAVDSLVLGSNRGGGWIKLLGSVPESGPARIIFRADNVSLHDVGRVIQTKAPLSGIAHVTMQGAGTSAAPVMNLQATLNDVRYGGLRVQRVRSVAEYRNRRSEVSVDLARGGRDVLFARGSLPMELTYFGMRLLDDTLRGTVRTDSASFDIVEALVPGLRDATGSLAANLDVRGTWSHPDVAGALRVDNGEVTIEPLGIRVRGVNVDLGLFGHADSLAIRRLSGWSGTSAADSLAITGYIAYDQFDNPDFNLRMHARTFHALDQRTLARLDVSTEQGGIRLRGPLRGATLSGGLVVDRGTVYLPDPELARKRRVDLTSQFTDTTDDVRDAMPQPPSKLMESLLLDGVRVTLGDEVWLRSREANIKLAGALTVQRVREQRLLASVGQLGADSVRYVPLFDGVLRAERGTYTLALGGYALQREFQVEGGTVAFYPVSGLPATLNISALHTVRTQGSEDLPIRVRLTGPLNNPIVSLESAGSIALSQSDLVSYLLFGQPNFELGERSRDYVRLAMQTIFPSAQTFAQAQLRNLLGSYADVVQFQAAPADATLVTGDQTSRIDAFSTYFLSSRVGAEKQISDKLFVSVGTGLCGLVGGDEGNSEQHWTEALSGKIEWRFSRDASLRAGKEPSAMACRPGLSRVVPAPSQWGFSLFKTWRF